MVDAIHALLESMLVRKLQLDPRLTPQEAIAHINGVVTNVLSLDADRDAVHVRHRGVLNPVWLQREEGVRLYYYTVRAPAGGRLAMQEQARALERATTVQVFGDLDLLISLYGSQEEADALLQRVESLATYEWMFMSVSRVLLFHRHLTRESSSDAVLMSDGMSAELVNRIVDDYDSPDLSRERQDLENAGVLLGPTWQLDPVPSLTDVTAFVGINGQKVDSTALLDAMLADALIRSSLIHFMELDEAQPFQWLAKVVCHELDELDHVTDAMVSQEVGAATLETTTFITGRASEPLPRIDEQRHRMRPDLRAIESLARHVLGRLGSSVIPGFNGMDPRLQLVVLDSLCDLEDRVTGGPWDDRTRAELGAILRLFGVAAIDGTPSDRMAAPIGRLAGLVEAVACEALERIDGSARGMDERGGYGLRTVAAMLRKAAARLPVEESWLDRLERFAGETDRWARSATAPAGLARGVIVEAAATCTAGIDLVRQLVAAFPPEIDGDRA